MLQQEQFLFPVPIAISREAVPLPYPHPSVVTTSLFSSGPVTQHQLQMASCLPSLAGWGAEVLRQRTETENVWRPRADPLSSIARCEDGVVPPPQHILDASERPPRDDLGTGKGAEPSSVTLSSPWTIDLRKFTF